MDRFVVLLLHKELSSSGLTGRSSTPRLLDSITGVSGILGRPVKPGDDGWEFGAFVFTTRLRILAARCARGVREAFALKKRGRGECRALNAPAASRAEINKAHERSHHRSTGFTRHSRTQWFYGLLRALPGDQACLTPSPALLIADLTPALGRQNDTTWPYAAAAFVTRAARVHRIPPRVRNVRNAPLRDGTVRISEVIWVRREAKYFFEKG
jgi:hypothetical protein